MSASSQKINRLCKNFIAALAVLIAVDGAASVALADDPVAGPCPPSGGPPGAVFTSDLGCTKINGNIYNLKTDVYLNGGPKAADRLDGNYYVRVLSPSGTLLGQSSGLVAFSPANCLPLWSIVLKASDLTQGYDDTDNNGGEYKVEVSCDPGFVSSSTKSDNFKVRENVTACEGVKVVCLSCPLPFTVDCQGHVGPDNAVGALVTLPEPIVTGGDSENFEWCTINGEVKSGEIFIAQGTVTVTCTVTNGAGNTDTCSYDITVNPCPECMLGCPLVPNVCANLAGCQAVVSWDPPVCPEAGVTVTSSGGNSGDPFGLGSHTVTYTARMDVDQSVLSTCDVTFNVVKPALPQITSCPTVAAVNGAGQCSATATFTPPTATGNCNASVLTVVCDHLSGSSFPIGTTKVTCSATDLCGQSASCFFNVVVKGQICVTKFYDSDFSGAKNGSEVVIPNWKITLSDGQVGYTGTTDGKVCFNVVAGTYSVTEELKTGYIASAGTTRTGVLVDSTHCNPSVCIGNVKVLNTGALTMGFWQNKNGQGVITNYCGGTSGKTLKAFLNCYKPFQETSLTNATTCSALATYVSNIIKAANASGASMNAMLKAQMLATALDVYFSDPTLGGVKIAAPSGPIGSVSIDLQAICKMIDNLTTGAATCSGIYQPVSAAFGGATCLTVSQLLTYAASQSNAGGGAWYGQVKATQELAKNTFDAINNQVALACGP